MNTLELIFTSDTFNDFLTKSLLLFFFGLTVRQCLVLCGQRWANTYHHLATYVLLPNIALMLTTVIKNDIALSLGMIGALSIVRFRNPVKSPFELVIFFGLMTLGIISTVQIYLSVYLYLIIMFAIIGLKIIDIFGKKLGFNLTQISFGDGNLHYTLEITALKELENLKGESRLINYYLDNKEKNFFYRFNFKNKIELREFEKKIKNFPEITNIRVDMQD